MEPKIEETGSNKLKVCWSPPSEGEHTGYRVEWKSKDGSSEEKEKKDEEKEEGTCMSMKIGKIKLNRIKSK